jgi:hypothetical protein
MKTLAAFLLLCAAAFGQNRPTTKPRAACGSENIRYEVKNEKREKPAKGDKSDGSNPGGAEAAPETAEIFVIENLRASCFLCDSTTRIAMDGTWVGATKGNSYFSFPADAGEHHLCAELQSGAVTPETTSLSSFTADGGKTYYFRVRLTDMNNSGKGGVDWSIDLEPIDSDEGQFLVSSYEMSSSHPKK